VLDDERHRSQEIEDQGSKPTSETEHPKATTATGSSADGSRGSQTTQLAHDSSGNSIMNSRRVPLSQSILDVVGASRSRLSVVKYRATSDFRRQVARHFHADAYFGQLRGRPSHRYLR
jgi:hypothetical protein